MASVPRLPSLGFLSSLLSSISAAGDLSGPVMRPASSPRMQFLASKEVAVNLQPDLYVDVEGVVMMWKFGMSKDSRPEHIIRMILQILGRASKHKGLEIPIKQIRFSGHNDWQDIRRRRTQSCS
jgi:hypothetical protein